MTKQTALEQHREKLMNRIMAGYEQYKDTHPSFKKEEEERERRQNELKSIPRKGIPNPKVKYETRKCMGHTQRYKYTLLATITGPEAQALMDCQERGHGLHWHPVSDNKLEIYDDELIKFDGKREHD